MSRRARFALWCQCQFGRMAAIFTVPLIICAIKLAGYRVRDLRGIRRRVRRMMQAHNGPWLICANHLTMIDSVILAYAMLPLHRYILQYRLVPWNVPEHRNFNRSLFVALLCYLVKCVPIKRGGDRAAMKRSLGKCEHMMQRGQNLMIFPEGTRSRTGRVSSENCTYHVGRLVHKIPDARVMCFYLRGDRQKTYSNFPRFGETFTVTADEFRPQTALRGLRAHRDCARQIIDHLSHMEAAYFDTCGQRHSGSQSTRRSRQRHRRPVYAPGVDTR